ncbi:unnamed protein product [Lota lota]
MSERQLAPAWDTNHHLSSDGKAVEFQEDYKVEKEEEKEEEEGDDDKVDEEEEEELEEQEEEEVKEDEEDKEERSLKAEIKPFQTGSDSL